MKRMPRLCAALAASFAAAAPVVPGEFTDPTNLRREAEGGAGDGAFDLGRLPAGEYDVAVWAIDEKGRESHRVWHTFRVVEPKELELPADKVYAVTKADLDAYGIRADGDLGRKVLVEIPDPPEGTKGDAELRFALEALDAYARTNPPAPRKGAPGYTVLVAAKDGRPVVRSFRKPRIVYDRGYDTNAVEQAAIAADRRSCNCGSGGSPRS